MTMPVKLLVRIRHGSHLYGTSTPASDQDFKSVHLPSGDAIVLGRPENHIDRSTKWERTEIGASSMDKNTREDIDDTAYSLAKFLDMIATGDTVATEILFADDSNIVEMAEEWPLIRAEAQHLISRHCVGFVSYCKHQAAKYGIKGSRMGTCRALVEMLGTALKYHGTTEKLGLLETDLRLFCRDHEFAEIVDIPTQQGKELLHLDALGKKIPYTGTIKHAYDVFNKIFETYGARARMAESNEGVDWKAMSHAVRVARQAIELLTTGKVTFPRPDAAELLAIKKGERSFNEVSTLLEELVSEVEIVSERSRLPEETDVRLRDLIVHDAYLRQIVGGLAAESVMLTVRRSYDSLKTNRCTKVQFADNIIDAMQQN